MFQWKKDESHPFQRETIGREWREGGGEGGGGMTSLKKAMTGKNRGRRGKRPQFVGDGRGEAVEAAEANISRRRR